MAAPDVCRTLLLKDYGSCKPEMFTIDSKWPTPRCGPKDILCSVDYAAINPVDFKIPVYSVYKTTAPRLLGVDFAGHVVAMGDMVTKFGLGQAVFGMLDLMRDDTGAFSEYCCVHEDMASPASPQSGLSLEQYATVPLPSLTACAGLFEVLKLPIPRATESHGLADQSILICGGSSTVGMFAIQLAKMLSMKVVTTCSERNFNMCRSLGADHCIDRSGSDVAGQIRALKLDPKYAFDAVGTHDVCSKSMDSGLAASCVPTDSGLPFAATPSECPVKVKTYRVSDFPTALSSLLGFVTDCLNTGKLRPQNVKLIDDLQSVPRALCDLMRGKISAERQVVRIRHEPVSPGTRYTEIRGHDSE